jgi:hypothetical protein
MMVGKAGSRRALLSALLAVMFGVVLTVTPGLHHDFACHQNSRTHCNSCLGSQSAPHIDICTTPFRAATDLSGKVEMRASAELLTPTRFYDSGRSPPA